MLAHFQGEAVGRACKVGEGETIVIPNSITSVAIRTPSFLSLLVMGACLLGGYAAF